MRRSLREKLKLSVKQAIRHASRVRAVNRATAYIESVREDRVPAGAMRPLGTFDDEHGHAHRLYAGIRDWLKPDWRGMFQQKPPAVCVDLGALDYSVRTVAQAAELLASLNVPLAGAQVLEVGSGAGYRSFALAELGAEQVLGSEFVEYAKKSDGESQQEAKSYEGRQRQLFQCTADHFARHRDEGLPARVRQVEDSIIESGLQAESFDLVASWEVLEHLNPVSKAFSEIARLLRPGGHSFHQYNPFFSLTGGHSLCTLDFLWGHARLSSSDFHRYVSQWRPGEIEAATGFFNHNLNRMTHADLRAAVEHAGLEMVAFIPWNRRLNARLLEAVVLDQVRGLHPTASLEDLMAESVWVVVRKPA